MSLVFAVALAITACSCESTICGPEEAGVDGLSVEVSGAGQSVSLRFSSFNSSPNNDCTPMGRTPTSITLDGTQVGQPNFHMTFCVPRPDQIDGNSIDLSSDELVEIIDINGFIDSDCLVVLDRTQPATGTITFHGYCAEGLDELGYAIELDVTVPGTKVCVGDMNSSVAISLSGRAAVEAL